MKGIAKADKTASTNTLVIVKNDIPVISHITIAENTNNDKSSIKRLIENNLQDFEEFGAVGFEIQVLKAGTGSTKMKEYFLNEQQATLLMTYLRNNAVVKEFKKNLVRAFYALKEKSELPTSISSPEQMNEIITNFIKTHDMLETENYMTLMMAPFKVFWAYQKKNENLTKLLEEQHELIGELTAENGKLTKENHNLKNDPLSMLVTSLKIATGREVQLSLGPTTGNNIDHTHTTIKGFCAEHKIKLAHGDSIRFSNILKSLCKQAGEIIEKIPDARYGTLNIYPRYLLADAVKFL